MVQTQGEKVLLKLDVKNAFNSIHRDTVQAAQTHLPEIYPFIWDCYSSNNLSFMESSALTQPLGCNKETFSAQLFLPLPFTELQSMVKSDLNVWYLDDGCIGGDLQTVLSDAVIRPLGMDYPQLA